MLQVISLAAKSLSYCSSDALFCYSDKQRADQNFVSTYNTALARADAMILFIGDSFSGFQSMEACSILTGIAQGKPLKLVVVSIISNEGIAPPIPDEIGGAKLYPIINIPSEADHKTLSLSAQEIVSKLGMPWHSWDDLPVNPHLFSYEKDIVKFFWQLKSFSNVDQAPPPAREKILQGCPTEWPEVVQWAGNTANRLKQDKVGKWRSESDRVDVVASSRLRAELGSKDSLGFGSFVEAGPRRMLRFPQAGARPMRVAILVSGGIAPGINAVIDGIVQRHYDYATGHGYADWLEVWGIQDGFRGTDYLPGSARRLIPHHPPNAPNATNYVVTCDHAHEGGSCIGTSRVDHLLQGPERQARVEQIATRLKQWADIVYLIGGDGSMKAAHAIWNVANDEGRDQNLSVITIPKTMDNDILWVWQSFGFLSAVEKAREVIEQLSTEVTSNPRLGIIQLFGSDSGFVVSHAVLATATQRCMVALIPEVNFTMTQLAEYVAEKMSEARQTIPHGLIVMAETAIPMDAEDFIEDVDVNLTKDQKKQVKAFCAARLRGTRIQGQTDDDLRSAALAIVSRGLKKMLPKVNVRSAVAPDWKLLRLLTNEPRHILRATPPSCSDIITGHRLGTSAVDAAMAGYTDAMISQWLTEFVIVPLKLVILGRKRIPRDGIFWKSVLAKTGQPSDLETALLARAAGPS